LLDLDSPGMISTHSSKTIRNDGMRDMDTPYFGKQRMGQLSPNAYEISQKSITRADTGDIEQREDNGAKPRPLKLNLTRKMFKVDQQTDAEDFYTNDNIY
jgi:hypothetical protein